MTIDHFDFGSQFGDNNHIDTCLSQQLFAVAVYETGRFVQCKHYL